MVFWKIIYFSVTYNVQETLNNGKKILTSATSPEILHAFHPKWVHSPVEPAHILQNPEITWFLYYNVIHSPTSTFSNCPVVWIYLFFPWFSSSFFFVCFKSVTEILSYLDKLDGFKADMVNVGSGWAFLMYFFTKDVFNVYSCCNMYQYYTVFPHSN